MHARLKSISAVMGAPRPGYDMLGRTSHLTEDLNTIFKVLGYNSTVIARLSSTSAYHCISSCAMLDYNAPHNNEIVVGYNATSRGQVMREAATADTGKLAEKKSENVQWYDTATARIIRTHFQAGFERFNFSRIWTWTLGNAS